MSGERVLLVDDDDTLRKVLARELQAVGFAVTTFASAEGVVDAALGEAPDVALLDLRLPGVDGLSLLRDLRAADAQLPVVLLTGHGAVPEAVEAMKLGAQDFLTKPVRLEVLEQVLRRAVEKRALAVDNQRLKRALSARLPAARILGDAPAMRELRRAIERVAKSDTSLLIQGENGTGKELVAQAVHAASARADAPFVVVNCGAIPESLFESELFGHERGAFTGADRKRIGLFEAAHGGSLFLDEIGELPKSVQPALLRALQFGELRPVGGERTRKVDARVIAATNRKLLDLIGEGEFREDLYYRVAALQLDVPPLRERREDVRALAREFVARSASRMGRRIELGEDALARLETHDWPGNVRELENAAERLCVMSDSERIDAELVERYVLRGEARRGALPTLSLDELERLAVLQALATTEGDKRTAAEMLGVSLKTLYNKLDRYGLRPAPDAGSPPQ